jgi:hypothetical protein
VLVGDVADALLRCGRRTPGIEGQRASTCRRAAAHAQQCLDELSRGVRIRRSVARRRSRRTCSTPEVVGEDWR